MDHYSICYRTYRTQAEVTAASSDLYSHGVDHVIADSGLAASMDLPYAIWIAPMVTK